MFSYAVGLLACLLVLYTPLSQLIFGRPPSAAPSIRRTPRPAVNESLLALDDWPGNLTCGEDRYSVHLFSKEPLIIYIQGFLSLEERAHLLDIRLVPPRCARPKKKGNLPSPWACNCINDASRMLVLTRKVDTRMTRFGLRLTFWDMSHI